MIADSVSESRTLSKPDLILFTSQIAILFVVIIASLVNLTFNYGNQNLWTVVLTSSLGYIMPNPKLKRETKPET